MVDKLKQQYGHVTNICVDAANPEVWQALKREFSEQYDEQYIREKIAYAKKYNLHVEDHMFIVPVPFSIGSTDVAAYKVVVRRTRGRRFKLSRYSFTF
jgi:hypothetical protein